MLKFGFVVPEFPSQTHAFFWRELAAMEELGAEITLLSTRNPGPDACPHAFREQATARTTYLFPPRGAWGKVLLRRPLRVLSMMRYVAGLSETSLPARARLMALIPSAAALVAVARRNELRHVHIHSCANAAHLGALAHILDDLSYSLTLHGDLPVYGTDHKAKSARAAFVSAVTRPLAKSLQELNSDLRTPVIMMGVDTGRFQPFAKPQSETFTLATIARLNKMKGHRFVLRAMALLRDQGETRLRYVIAGSGTEEANIKAEVASLGLEDQVEMLGPIGEDKVLDVLQSADALALTSYGRGEAAPVAVMEAMSCGLPVISSIIGGVPDMIEDGVDGLLVPQEDVEAIQAALKRLLEDPEGAVTIGVNARATALKLFDYRTNAKLLLDQIAAGTGIS